MGYYTGNGVVSGGGSNIVTLTTGWDGSGYYNVEQKITSSVTTKNGVGLSTAEAVAATSTMTYHRFSGGLPMYNAKGSRSNANYSRIGDSNLYVLSVTSETIVCRLNGGDWQS